MPGFGTAGFRSSGRLGKKLAAVRSGAPARAARQRVIASLGAQHILAAKRATNRAAVRNIGPPTATHGDRIGSVVFDQHVGPWVISGGTVPLT